MSNPTRLMYSKSNQAFVFVFGDQLLRLGSNRMFYRNKADAIRAALNQGLVVDKKGFVTSVEGGSPPEGTNGLEAAERTATLRTPVGTRVRFQPNPASHLLYSNPPEVGEEGEVTTVAHIGGRRSFMKGPGGGLLYVKWDNLGTMGVAPQDAVLIGGSIDKLLDRVRAGESEVTLDTEGSTEAHINKIIKAAEARGFSVSRSRRHLLIRDLRFVEAPQSPASGFGKEKTQEDYRRRIAWEHWAERKARSGRNNAVADGHALARKGYEDEMRRKFGSGTEGTDFDYDAVVAVIFRVWKDNGKVIALFPYEEVGGGLISSYEHVGQHGSADYNTVMAQSRPAKLEEYAALKRELESPPYNYRFRVVARRQRGGTNSGKRTSDMNGVEGIDEDFEPVRMNYGEMPERDQFLEQTKDEYPYPMELVGGDQDVVEALNIVGEPGITQFVPSQYPHKMGVRVQDGEAMYRFLSALVEFSENDDHSRIAAENASSLASSIMGTLGYEWV